MGLTYYLSNFVRVLIEVFVIFPYSALTIPRQHTLPPTKESMKRSSEDPKGISDELYALCTSSESVSSLLAVDPLLAPGDAWKKLYGHGLKHHRHEHAAQEPQDEGQTTEKEKILKSGKWGSSTPSDLFLTIYGDALKTIEKDTEQALVSPSLIGSSGVAPLTIISVVPDIARHMSNLIVRAEKEVIIATNYWSNGVAAKFITNAIRELSRRAGERGTRAVVKIIYDRGSAKQVIEPHYIVSEREFTNAQVGIPPRAEIPNIDLEVMNYHHPMLGTFHSKFMVVDRRIAILQSNNIQDNDNMEMMTHIEGPIVDSMYDMALISWHKKLQPPLPSHNSPAVDSRSVVWGDKHSELFTAEGTLKNHPVVLVPSKLTWTQAYGRRDNQKKANGVDAIAGPTIPDRTTHPVNGETKPGESTPQTAHSNSAIKGPDSQANDLLGAGVQAVPETQIEHPVATKDQLPEHTADDPHYDEDIAGEVARMQASVSPKPGESRMQAVTRHLNHTTNVGFKGDAPDCALHEAMTPYIPLPVHGDFPIAMVSRPPYGTPNHKSVSNPQNEAWLSALRNAKKNVFIQSPTLNAAPLVPAIIEACERGIDVYCYICLGYNDEGELLPMQGGHNEMVAHKLYAALSAPAKLRLHYFWYVAKDQTKPILQFQKRRSCHVKLMIVDEHIGIMGSGNQDTQSWFHSQETNIMIDSSEVCRSWIDAVRRNQNTHIYGALSQEDGVWRDVDGKEADGVIGVDPGKFSWAKGLIGAVKRVQGKGGFG